MEKRTRGKSTRVNFVGVEKRLTARLYLVIPSTGAARAARGPGGSRSEPPGEEGFRLNFHRELNSTAKASTVGKRFAKEKRHVGVERSRFDGFVASEDWAEGNKGGRGGGGGGGRNRGKEQSIWRGWKKRYGHLFVFLTFKEPFRFVPRELCNWIGWHGTGTK